MTDLQALHHQTQHLEPSDKMPVLFVGHGSPMNAIEDNEFVQGFKTIAKTIKKPSAILCISAHWFTAGTKVTAMNKPPTIHDFSGFPGELYKIQYPAKGHPSLAKLTKELLKPTDVEFNYDWGLDHGTWSVLIHMYPKADIPVIQMSIDRTKPAQYHFELARMLSSLRNKGVLIVASGNIIHNLRLVDFQNFNNDDYGFDWAREVHQTVNNSLVNRDFAPLLQYEQQGKAFQLAIPTPEHYLPLIYSIGLLENKDSITLFNDKLMAGSLSMTSLIIS